MTSFNREQAYTRRLALAYLGVLDVLQTLNMSFEVGSWTDFIKRRVKVACKF